MYMLSPLCSGVWGATRSAVMGLGTLAVHDAGDARSPKVTPTLDWPSVISRTTAGVMERLDHLPHQATGPDDREADVDPVVSALVRG